MKIADCPVFPAEAAAWVGAWCRSCRYWRGLSADPCNSYCADARVVCALNANGAQRLTRTAAARLDGVGSTRPLLR